LKLIFFKNHCDHEHKISGGITYFFKLNIQEIFQEVSISIETFTNFFSEPDFGNTSGVRYKICLRY
jgi:hypothetical protein